jgi:hypothetical protein
MVENGATLWRSDRRGSSRRETACGASRVDVDRQRAVSRGHVERRPSLQERIHQLPARIGRLVPEMSLGSRVIVLKGDPYDDLGQMAIVSRLAGSQVEISYRGPNDQIKTRRKQRASLIRMEDDVELAISAEGWPIIGAKQDQETTDDNSRTGLVSSDDDSQLE